MASIGIGQSFQEGRCSYCMCPQIRLRSQPFKVLRTGRSTVPKRAHGISLGCSGLDRSRKALRCSAFTDDKVRDVSTQPGRQAPKNPFQGYREQPDGIQTFLGNTPQPVLIAAAVAVLGVSGLLGNVAGSQAPAAQRAIARVIGTVAASGAALFGLNKLKEKREAAAVIALYQTLANHPDLGTLSAEEISAVGSKFGISLAKSRIAEMKSIYGTFLESVIPIEDSLKGDEVEKIRAFKDALGLSFEDAAPAHIDVGRRFHRLSNESSKAQKDLYRRALNKLIYVSGLLFGERQEAFMLPWKRIVGYTDASMYIAKRDQAKALFKEHIESYGDSLPADKQVLADIKAFQSKVKVEDGLVEEAVRESTRDYVESRLEKAAQCLKQRGRVRDYSDLVKEVQAVVEYSLDLQDLAEDPDLPKGLGKVTVYGGKFEAEKRTRELRDVFRTYLEEQLRLSKELTDDVEDDLQDLQAILGLGKKEAADITSEVTSRAYRQLLREEVSSGRLDKAASKADILAELCNKLNFDPDAASALHKQLYRQKLDSLLEKKSLTDSDSAELDRQRRLLCIKKQDVQQVHRETCGKIFAAAVEDALNAGHERFTFEDRDNVKKTLQDVRLDPVIAKDILSSTARKAFMGFISRSRNKANKLEAAKELKALVYFSNIVVTPLLEDINGLSERAGASQEAAQKELAEMMVKAKEMAEKEEAEAAKTAVQSEEAAAPEAAATSSAPDERGAAEIAAAKALGADADADKPQDSVPEQQAAAEVSSPSTDADKPDEAVPATLQKSHDGLKKEEEASTSGKGMGSQKEINLREELDLRDRTDIYRNFLHYCMSGNVVSLPMGTTVQVQRDESEFARLSNLGDILGLTPMDINAVHTGLAEQAFRHQVQMVTGGGSLTAEKVQELEETRTKFGLSQESAQKIIKGAQNQHLISNMNAAKAQGGLTLQRLLDMEEQGVQITDVTSDELRASLYSKEMADALTSGSGDFDRARFLEDLPKKLGIKERKVNSVLEGLAKDRKRSTLVQSVSYLRQKNAAEVVKSLNNLLACHKALPSNKPEDWQPREEALDLWSLYISSISDDAKQQELAKILDIPPAEAETLRKHVASGEFKLEHDEAEADIF